MQLDWLLLYSTTYKYRTRDVQLIKSLGYITDGPLAQGYRPLKFTNLLTVSHYL